MFRKLDCSKVKTEMFISTDNLCLDLNLLLYLGLILVKLILFCILKPCRNNLLFNVNVRNKILIFIHILFVFMFKKMNQLSKKYLYNHAVPLRATLRTRRPESTGNVNHYITQNNKSSKMSKNKAIPDCYRNEQIKLH